MARLIVASILLMLIVAPILAARDPHPIRAMRRLLLYVVIVHVTYAFAVLVIYPRV